MARHINSAAAEPKAFGSADVLITLIAVATILVYADVLRFDFVNYDDKLYVTENAHVLGGLSWGNVLWAFSSFWDSNWFPLTLISHMADVSLYGMKAGLHHINNVFLHTANSILLFLFFRRVLGSYWVSGFIAAAFALHPVHVESVAWVSERKDVLSAFFWLLAMLSYVHYARRPQRPKTSRFVMVAIFFVLGLMTKPMPVTLPFVLLLLDYWPLGRISGLSPHWHQSSYEAHTLKQLAIEKVPIFIISAASAIVTLIAQRSGGAVASLETLPFGFRLENSAISYVKYIANTIFPYKLTILYPMPVQIPTLQAIGAAAILLVITAAALWKVKTLPYLFTGWFWFLGTLVPAIGLVQVGKQAMADRYNYMPSVGLFMIAAVGAAELLKVNKRSKAIIAVIATLLLLFYIAATKRQLQYWSNSIALYKHAIEATSGNKVAYYNLGITYAELGRYGEAIDSYENAVTISPTDCDALHNLGLALSNAGRVDEAEARFATVIRINPRYEKSYVAYGNILLNQNRLAEAMTKYKQALQINPLLPTALNGIGAVMAITGDQEGALVMFDKALSINPGYTEALNNKKNTLALIGRRGIK
ncbi:MAG: tetratricopeptide repeat protein [Nitrospirae bacterium]|nr:tetratricopeptide repeat protein [Nitrospirota bacterium]